MIPFNGSFSFPANLEPKLGAATAEKNQLAPIGGGHCSISLINNLGPAKRNLLSSLFLWPLNLDINHISRRAHKTGSSTQRQVIKYDSSASANDMSPSQGSSLEVGSSTCECDELTLLMMMQVAAHPTFQQ